MKKVFIISYLFCTASLSAQPYLSNQGAFSVSQIEGCAPLTVTISEVGFTGFCTCNYRIGSTPIVGNSHTFTQPGTYIISGNAQAGANPSSDQIIVTVNANTLPDFEVSSCNNNQVSVKVTTTQFDSYIIDFDNNLVDDISILKGGNQSANFSYGSAGLKTITVRGKDQNAADNCTKRSQTFTAVPALVAPVINTLAVNDANSIDLDYTPSAQYQYRAQISTNSVSSFQPFQTIHSTSATPQNITMSGLTTESNYYCFRLNSYDACTNTSVNSNVVCSVDFDATAANDVNQLTWQTALTGVTNFSVMRNNVLLQTVTTNSFNDTGITCNTEYDYTIITNYSNGSTSTSLSKSVTSFTNTIPTKIENISALAGDLEVSLEWVQPAAFTADTYSIQRSAQGGVFEGIGLSNANQFTDNQYITAGQYCYQISYRDVCNNNSPFSNTICPIRLLGTVTASNNIQLDWSAYEGWKQGVKNYTIEKMDVTGSIIKTFTTKNLDLLDDDKDPDNQIVKYRVTANPLNIALTPSISNMLTLTREVKLVFPTAFTPNRDRLNDNFSVAGEYVESLTLQIFDRWGQLIFSTDERKAWDGTLDGKVMPESTYIWKASITDKTGRTFTEIGTVALLRKAK